MEEALYHAEEKETEVYKCPQCGANLNFDPDRQVLRCDHCGYEEIFQASHIVELVDFATGERPKNTWGNETKVYRCNNCGSTEILSATEIAKTCPFCGTTNIVETSELPGIRPTAVIPFLFGEEKAREYFTAWIKKRWFVPSKLKKEKLKSSFNGVYSPAWVYDADTISSYRGRLGEHYTVTVGSGKNRRTETRTRWYTVSGVHYSTFKDLIIEASPYLTQAEVNALKPFRMDVGVEYDKRYLAGFSASNYERDVDACWPDACQEMKAVIRREILNKYHADVVDYLHFDPGYHNVKFKYLLLPVYICNYFFEKKTYRFYVNGCSGKVVGKVPRSPAKIAVFSAAVIAILAVIIVLCEYFL